MPYLKVKCQNCGKIIHLYFKEGVKMPKAEKGGCFEYVCPSCGQETLAEVLFSSPFLPDQI